MVYQTLNFLMDGRKVFLPTPWPGMRVHLLLYETALLMATGFGASAAAAAAWTGTALTDGLVFIGASF